MVKSRQNGSMIGFAGFEKSEKIRKNPLLCRGSVVVKMKNSVVVSHTILAAFRVASTSSCT